ncbi:hypothetical protein GKZ89_13020 [Bacillus mangrovi]|uniref:Uncharacterized protein n=1 Tax=Metabacillus mangrovi TaxID=1491830 RepID=A0A7X2S6W4_9BACI|nr:hypothetical protein [Metabacillus mangrovi]MTH54326.1 hypothetical protein [Metabacillus mangrovi]
MSLHGPCKPVLVLEAAAVFLQRRYVSRAYIRYLLSIQEQVLELKNLLDAFTSLALRQLEVQKALLELKKIRSNLLLVLSKEFVFPNDLKEMLLHQTIQDMKRL